MDVLQRLITTVLTYLNAAGYYKSAEEIQNAINVAQLDLYKRLRGNLAQYAPGRPSAAVNPEQTNVTADALWELYLVVGGPGNTDTISLLDAEATYNKTIDILLSLEVDYSTAPGDKRPVSIVPDNQFLMLKNNPVVPPIKERPIGRLSDYFTYQILPGPVSTWSARVLTLPNPVSFTFTESNGPIPTINVITPIDWTDDKLDNLVYGTVANLGFNLSNGVLVQSGNAMNDKIL